MRIAIVDDDPIITDSLSTILGAEADLEICGVAADAPSAVRLYEQVKPDILLLDIQMGATSGLDAARAILAGDGAARIVFLTTFSDDEYIVAALRMGAKGYLIKQQVAAIAPALRSVLAGQSVLGEQVVGRIDALFTGPWPGAAAGAGSASEKAADAVWPPAAGSTRSPVPAVGRPAPGADQLSDREAEVVALVSEGLDNREIAGRMYLSEGTVRNHISAILTKLSLRNRTQLAIWHLTGGR
ncbi:MAG: response regulator transcription factor [Bifidobacteriaceae bacterium]|jgi:DNA-binding NarL/FixJ family response regulator|nr:response regulator transcription factor [Bifidobacteriaceae bacterium]